MRLMDFIIIVSVGISIVLYEIVGDFGYLLFGRDVSPNVIQMCKLNNCWKVCSNCLLKSKIACL
jgi:amino acid permease